MKFNFIADFSKIEDDKNFSSRLGSYNAKNNILDLSPLSFKKIWEISQKADNPEDFYWKEINSLVLHELTHMASAKYSDEERISYCGYDSYPQVDENFSNRGLTEGMTEVITMTGVPGTVEIASGYYAECLFVKQLIEIVGQEVMLESYFSTKGTIEIEKALNNIIDDKKNSQILFRRIEDNFYLKNVNCKQSVLSNIQGTLIKYYKQKTISAIKNFETTYQEAQNSMYVFESMLMTTTKLVQMRKNPTNYIGLLEVMTEFEEFKKEFESLISNNAIGNLEELSRKRKL